MSTIIFTAIFGMKDVLRDPLYVENDVEYICFSDYPQKSKVWNCIHVKLNLDSDPCRAAKPYKLVPHRFSELDTDRSIWVDGNIEIVDNLTCLLDSMGTDLAFFSHHLPNQICIYREAEECIRKGYDDAKLIAKTVERFRIAGHPENWGLPMARVIFRNHTKQIKEFNETWFQEVREGSRRDQLSLPYVLRNMKIPFREFEATMLYNNDRPWDNYDYHKVRIHQHQW